MLFNSAEFLWFFPLVTLGFFVLPFHWRWIWLLAASCGFYMFAIPAYIAVLAFTITLDYWLGRWIECSNERQTRWLLITASFAANLGILGAFKYLHFIGNGVEYIARALGVSYTISLWILPLPIGLSFHTFQSLSYTTEIYRRRQQAERHFGIFALYVMFYPQLVAGPIERPQNMLHQFREKQTFDYDRIVSGLRRIAFGLFRKVVVADQLAFLVAPVYSRPGEYSAGCHGVATAAFAFEIYNDFAGYSDIAIGAARVMGFQLMENFDRPYSARSIGDFWRRWHISLSTWFRDYVYIPLGGNRQGPSQQYRNLMMVFILSGLWHGARWTFVLWGALHGFWMVASDLSHRWRARWACWTRIDQFRGLHSFLQLSSVWLLVGLTWVFFRSDSIGDAKEIIRTLGQTAAGHPPLGRSSISQLFAAAGLSHLIPGLTGLALVEAVGYAKDRLRLSALFKSRPAWQRYAAYLAFVFYTVAGGAFGESQFIYFQF